MEIGLKERLIGAVVIVILAVIIIPWVLKGGSPSTTVTKPLTLPAAATSHAQPAYHMDLSSPPAAATGVQSLRAATHAAALAAAPAAASVVRPAAHKPKAAATGGWAVQAGSFGNEANARSVQEKLAKHGYHAFISRFTDHKHTFYRVRVGPYPDRAAAEHAASGIIQAYGGKAVVVPNH
ncbi:MAG: SPOR domain-containing protein [Gammaproteobacteria bacterium]|nr:SPOR domain-containing protein [Gammaproteobacteria bacterium]MDE2345291.1 SPOR domain-containing protein [Gammaproteobacteria bacterium]